MFNDKYFEKPEVYHHHVNSLLLPYFLNLGCNTECYLGGRGREVVLILAYLMYVNKKNICISTPVYVDFILRNCDIHQNLKNYNKTVAKIT